MNDDDYYIDDYYYIDDDDYDDYIDHSYQPPRPCPPDAKRVYLEDLKPGDLVTIFDSAHPEGVDAIVWNIGFIDDETTALLSKPMLEGNKPRDGRYSRVQWLLWNADKTDYRLTPGGFTADFCSDRGLINPDPLVPKFPGEYTHRHHYVVAR